MSLKQDVLEVLSDPVLGKMNFFVEDVHIESRQYAKVQYLIENDAIEVEHGEEEGKAAYSMSADRLVTQKESPLASLEQRGLIIHECTHAIIDMDQLRVTRLTSEAAAYLAQVTYLLLKKPTYTSPAGGFFSDFVDLAKKHKLHQSPNPPPKVSRKEYETLASKMKESDFYADKDLFAEVSAYGIRRPLSDKTFRATERIDPDRHVEMLAYPQPSERKLIATLKRRYAKSDVAGYIGRVRELEMDFTNLTQANAKSLYARLVLRKRADRISRYFHDHLSTLTRTRLLNIIYSRI